MKAQGFPFVSYVFYKVAPEWYHLERVERERTKNHFGRVLTDFERQLFLRAYSTVGFRAEADMMVWRAADALDDLREMTTALRETALGRYLVEPYSYLSIAAAGAAPHGTPHGTPHPFADGRADGSQAARYLVLRPVTVTREWHVAGSDAQREVVNEAKAIAAQYPSVRVHATCALDDHDFILACEADDLRDVLAFTAALRRSELGRYTERDTPAFTCVGASVWEMLDALGRA